MNCAVCNGPAIFRGHYVDRFRRKHENAPLCTMHRGHGCKCDCNECRDDHGRSYLSNLPSDPVLTRHNDTA